MEDEMKDTLIQGISGSLSFQISEAKTVPWLYPESAEFQLMPRVLATGFMVGLIEWACITVVNEHLNWPEEQTVGTHINISHIAPTPPLFTVTVDLRLETVEGRRLLFSVKAYDGVDLISEGTHERHIINAERFNKRLDEKRQKKDSTH